MTDEKFAEYLFDKLFAIDDCCSFCVYNPKDRACDLHEIDKTVCLVGMKAYLSENTKENEASDIRPCDVAPMSVAPIRELFFHFMQTSGEDYCSQCAYNGTDTCALGRMTVTEDEAVFEHPNGFGTEPCLRGLYEFYTRAK